MLKFEGGLAMDINNANKIANIVNKINRYKSFLDVLDGRGYSDEFEIYYSGMKTCELEEPVLNIIIEYYKNEVKKAEALLERM